MNIKDYQQFTNTVALDSAKCSEYLFPGLAAEAGEVAQVYAKSVRDDVPRDEYISALIKELGDVLWFVSQLCNHHHLDIERVLQANVDKLTSRKERNVISGKGDNR